MCEGVPAYDTYKEDVFKLKAHLILITGDTILKVLCFFGPSAKLPYRACKIEGVSFKIAHKKRTEQVGKTMHHCFALLLPIQFSEHFALANKSTL